MELSEYLALRSEQIERQLDQLVPDAEVPYRILKQAARYSLLGHGAKRLRPILALATAEALGGDLAVSLVPACALEMIHTYSLIHDDLPCMDNDDFRRGKPSLHRAFPEGQALLAGDFLLTYAFDILAHHAALSSEKKIHLISILARYSGGEGMIAGQVMDLQAEGHTIDLLTLQLIHRKKTGAMITASIEFGAMLADASHAQLDILRQFGHDIGLAFQIADDILDVTACYQKRGQATSSDIANKKATYVSLLGLEAAQAKSQALLTSALHLLNQLACDTTRLAQLAKCFVKPNLLPASSLNIASENKRH